MRRVMGLLVGFLLFFPGAMILRWLVVDALRLYQEMSLTDALLVMVIMLACAIIFGQPRRALTADELEEQAEKMELASQRLEQAKRRLKSSRASTPARSRSTSSRRTSDRRRR